MSSMALDEFISEALTQIVQGIDQAKAKMGDRADWVSPPIHSVGQGTAIHDANLRVHYRDGTAEADLVRFDVAVHAASSGEGGGKAGLKLSVVSAELGGKKQKENKSISRIQFEVPLIISDYGNVIKKKAADLRELDAQTCRRCRGGREADHVVKRSPVSC